MIDWVTANIPCTHQERLNGGRIASINTDGEVEWMTEKFKSVPGSHESALQIKSYDNNHIWISGNPSKWLQGHNLFGSDDLCSLMLATICKVVDLLELQPTTADYHAWLSGNYQVSRVDCTAMWELPSRADVRSWLRAVESQAKSRHGRAISTNGTVYFGKNSRRWSLKFYSKGDELACKNKGHKLPLEINCRDKLLEYADHKLRGELTLRGMQLKELGLSQASAWNESTPLEFLHRYIESLDMAEQFSLTPAGLENLPPRLTLVYKAWKNGEDLRQIFSGSTFYRYRRELLKHGIDINIRQPFKPDNVIPLVRVIRPEAIAQVPDWAIDTPLYFDPRNRIRLIK